LKDSTDAILFDGLWKDRQSTIQFKPSLNWCKQDYIIPEFTLGEIKSVKRRQRFNYRSTATDGFFSIPTFEEAIKHMQFLMTNYERKVGSTTQPGLYIELKEPEWYMDTYGIDIG
jgi:hypothetical protein